MGDVVAVLADAADDVAVHDLDVVDVEEQLQVGRADPLDDVDAVVGVVALVAGMPLHRVRADAGVEHLEAEGDPLLLGVADDLLEALDAVVGADVVGDALAHAGEADHVLEPELGAGVDGVAGGLEHLLAVLGVVESLDERAGRGPCRSCRSHT